MSESTAESRRPRSVGPLAPKLKNAFLVLGSSSLSSEPHPRPFEIFVNDEYAFEMNYFHDGPLKVRGKKQRVVIFRTVFRNDVPSHSVVLSDDARVNLRVGINDYVKLYIGKASEVPRLTKIHFCPVEETLENAPNANIFDEYVEPFFNQAKIFITAGTTYKIGKNANDKKKIEFKVMQLEKEDESGSEMVTVTNGVVLEGTTLESGENVKKEDVEREKDLVGYDNIGGCSKQMAQIRELVELPLKRPQLFKQIGIRPPRGILLYGPPGTGKTLIARAIANETGAYLHVINGPEVMSKMSGESESNLRKAFEEAEKNAPSIIFMDEIDSLAPNREKTQGEVERRIVSQLLTLMDGMKERSNVIVLGATNRPNAVDPALRRFGRFDREVEIGVPDEVGRLEVLEIHTRNMILDEDVDMEEIAREIHGFTGSDIASLCSEAAMQHIREKLPYIDLDASVIDDSLFGLLRVNNANFKYAIANTDPSSLRETVIESPNVSWEDVGGLASVKAELIETIQYPVTYPEKFLKFGQNPSKGVLLYGPPGCGKTLLAKAVATQCKANFISIKGPELLTMYVGESESNVRQLFDRARGSAPCVLFFDEIDSIGRARSSRSNDGGVSDRVLNQLLAEMDGMNQKKNVFVIGATNRPAQLDSALMRPGRLDQLVYIPLPDEVSRLMILKAKLKKAPVGKDVQLAELVKATNGFSGADLSELCQRAAKLAIRESIEAEKRCKDGSDPVPCLTKKHFDDALKDSRRSVTDQEIESFEAFARSMKIDLKKKMEQQSNNLQAQHGEDEEDGLYD